MASEFESDSDAWAWAALEPEPTERERVLLDMFCTEYLVDFDDVAAARRVGFQDAFAEEYGKRFMRKAYVQKRLRALKEAETDPKAEARYNKRVVLNVLREVATNKYAPSAARVAAAKGLSDVYGLTGGGTKGGGIGNPGDPTSRGGVIMVPAIASLDDWEAAAMQSQTKLVEETRLEV